MNSPGVFVHHQETYDWPQWHDRTLEYDGTTGNYGLDDDYFSEWLSTDFLPDVEDQHNRPDISSISDHRSSVYVNPSVTLPSWTCRTKNSAHSPPRSADSTSSRPASPHQQACRVCNDTASGMHFGVMSCEACKSFFRRSIRVEAKYVCRGNRCCEIDKNTRNRCQHCRLQKCVNVGMKRNAVQEERTPYPTKEHKLSPKHIKSCSSAQNGPWTVSTVGIPFPFYSFGRTPVHMGSNSFNNDVKIMSSSVMLEILARAEEGENNPVLPMASPITEGNIPDSTRRLLLSVISWAKKIPMFAQLSVEDQIKLVKESWMEVYALKLIYHIAKFPTGSDVAFKNDHLAHLYLTDNPLVVSSIQKLTKECVAKMQDVQLDETELSCLKLIAFMNPCEY
ncbi:retinoic acid receptor RXR-gamma-A-like [Dysidea avara]|uniref:retinoic acid receptor RXR-gamma-A-like n=1 Tax=Dysidea avara TaxID=196820 RepID=UPI0033229536